MVGSGRRESGFWLGVIGIATREWRMNTARYVVALMIVVAMPLAVGYWFLIHPFIAFWRKLGRAPTYTIAFGLWVLSAYGIVQMADTILSIEFGTNYFLWPWRSCFTECRFGSRSRVKNI